MWEPGIRIENQIEVNYKVRNESSESLQKITIVGYIVGAIVGSDVGV